MPKSRCRRPHSRIVMMRKKNVFGPWFQKAGGKCVKSVGSEYDGGISILPAWTSSLPDVNVSQAGSWTIDLQDYVYSDVGSVTFAIASGSLPTGITLNANGTFSGTVTDPSGSGAVVFTATDANGSTNGPTLSWTIP